MKDQFGEQLGRALFEVRLTTEEKTQMRSALLEHMHAGVPTPGRPVPSPYFAFSIFHVRAFAGALIVVFLVSTGGISYAAEGALPGDLLYPIKISVNEEVRVALARSDVERAAVEAERAERRLEEAGKLASVGKLSPGLEQEIAMRFEAQANVVAEKVAVLSETDANASDEISERFEAALSAHEAVLDRLAFGGRTEENHQVALVTEKVRAQTSRLAERRLAYAEPMAMSIASDAAVSVNAEVSNARSMTMVMKVAPDATATSEDISSEATGSAQASVTNQVAHDAALRNIQKASSTLEATIALFSDVKGKLSAGAQKNASKEIAAIQVLLGDASEVLAREELGIARGKAHEALTRSVKLGVFLKAEAYLGAAFSNDGDEDSSSTPREEDATGTDILGNGSAHLTLPPIKIPSIPGGAAE